MNELELKKLWQMTNDKLEASQVINKENTKEIMQLKVLSFIGSMKPIKVFTLLVGILWVAIVGTIVFNLFLYAFNEVSPFFLFSAAIQVFLTALALFIYIYQLITIYQVDITDPVLETQAKLVNLRISSLWVVRILILQLPLWTTFYWNESMIENGNWLLWILQGLVTVAFTSIAVWFFFNIKYENRHKGWFRLIFTGREWTPLMKSLDLLEQVKSFKG